jgi:hypothetical protein
MFGHRIVSSEMTSRSCVSPDQAMYFFHASPQVGSKRLAAVKTTSDTALIVARSVGREQ